MLSFFYFNAYFAHHYPAYENDPHEAPTYRYTFLKLYTS